MKINQHPPQEEIDQLKRLLDKGKYSFVFKNAETIIQKYPNSFIIWNLLGIAAYEIQKFETYCKNSRRYQGCFRTLAGFDSNCI